jgi:GNAT superfamily N-acetyltransferase
MSVRLELDDFGKEALEVQALRGSTRHAVIRTAARYYLADRGSGRLAWRPPPFASRGEQAGDAITDIELDEDTMDALEAEARRQGVGTHRLAEHALLYFLADLDSGRAATRLGEALERKRSAGLRRRL